MNPPLGDLVLYWTAFQNFIAGTNPYAFDSILQSWPMGLPGQPAGAFFYPPWMLIFFSPILALPLVVSAWVWFLLNVGCILLVSSTIWQHYSDRPFGIRPLLGSLLFLPIVDVLQWGQMGLFFAAAVALIITRSSKGAGAGDRNSSLSLMAIGLAVLTIKPQLFLPFFLLVLYWCVASRSFAVLLYSGAIIVVAEIVAEIVSPGITANWIHGISQPPVAFHTPTLSSILAGLLIDLTGAFPQWPFIVVPAVVLIAELSWLVLRRPTISMELDGPAVLALSLFVAPYAWSHDHAVLLPLHVALLALFQSAKLRWGVVVLGAFQLMLLLPRFTPGESQHIFFWFPLTMAIMWCYTGRKVRSLAV